MYVKFIALLLKVWRKWARPLSYDFVPADDTSETEKYTYTDIIWSGPKGPSNNGQSDIANNTNSPVAYLELSTGPGFGVDSKYF